MRERLFRGKKIDNEKWIEGYCITTSKRIPCLTFDVVEEEIEYFIISFTFLQSGMLKDLCCANVRPETVGQYTGRYDCEGKKIFEGDIVRTCEMNEILKVACNEEHGDFRLRHEDDIEKYYLNSFKSKELKVIGNIYDYPEQWRNSHK